MLAERLYQRIVSAVTVWNFLLLLLSCRTIKDAWEGATEEFCLDTGYKIRTSFIRNQAHLRTLLNKTGPPPRIGNTHPVFQTIQHLKSAFTSAKCPVSAFQIHFGKPFFR